MIIDGREIGPHRPPYIISEISGNHNGDLETALTLIKAAKYAGADAVKFQCYEADTITIDHDGSDFVIKDGLWKGRKLHDLYSKTQTPFEWFPTLFKSARERGITVFSSVFDKSSVDLLEGLECPAYKIASMEITDIPLIQYAAATGKPVIISTGMASEEEIDKAMTAAGSNSVALACTSGYPTKVHEVDLRKIGNSYFVQGISDHTVGDTIPIAATALGACIIEKHLRLDGVDTEDFEFSMDPIAFKAMVREVKNIWQAMQPKQTDAEASSRQLRRSLYVVKDIKKNEPFTEENIRSIRPAYGLEPARLSWVLTHTATTDLTRGTALKLEHVSQWEAMWSTPFRDSNPDFKA